MQKVYLFLFILITICSSLFVLLFIIIYYYYYLFFFILLQFILIYSTYVKWSSKCLYFSNTIFTATWNNFGARGWLSHGRAYEENEIILYQPSIIMYIVLQYQYDDYVHQQDGPDIEVGKIKYHPDDLLGKGADGTRVFK